MPTARTRSESIGPAARPVPIPDDLADPRLAKASGRVELPFHVRWSGPAIVYDLDDPRDRARVYEQVLREGTEDDIRYYVQVGLLIAAWREIVLPPHIRRAWARWVRGRYGMELSC